MSTLISKSVKENHILERYSTASVAKRQLSSDSKIRNSYNDRPRPVNFDNFLPWVCLEMQVANSVIVRRMNQEKLTILRRSSSVKAKPTKNIRSKHVDQESCNKGRMSTSNTIASNTSDEGNIIPVTAYYDPVGHLVEVAIKGCRTKIPRKVITAISFCVPFHSFLKKLTIRKGGIYSGLIPEIGRLLLHSHLTDVCLDDTYISEGNYYAVLDQVSNLKHLSLSRCKINDAVCIEIFSRLKYGQPAEKSLIFLDISSNFITNIGAKAVSEVLRGNRHLIHLNLAANLICDVGLSYILNPLSLFPLTYDETLERKRKIFNYTKVKLDVFRQCLIETSSKINKIVNPDTIRKISIKHSKFNKCEKNIIAEELSPEDLAERKTKEIVGEFNDPFDNDSVIIKNNYCYCVGNFKFCSLNISYNKLMFPSLVKILDVLKYQCAIAKKSGDTGLMRLILEGNYLPEKCYEQDIIEKYLTKAIAAKTPIKPSSKKSALNRPTIRLS